MSVVTTEVAQPYGKEIIDSVTKALALFISVTYVMGLIIVNSFLLTLGMRTATLLSAEYISAGLPLALLFVLAGGTAAFLGRSQQSVWAKVAILLLAILLISLIMLYSTNLADYLKTLRTIGLIFALLFVSFLIIIKDFSRHPLHRQDKFLIRGALYSLILLTLIVTLSTFYGRTVYNDILPTIGGGAGSTISLVTDGENGKVLKELVPMVNEVETEQVRLIRETSDSYLIVLADETSIALDKDIVKGVIYHRTRGWEIKPSILD